MNKLFKGYSEDEITEVKGKIKRLEVRRKEFKELKEKLESTKVTTIGDYIPSSPYNPWNIQPNWVGTLPTMTCAGVSNVQRD